MRPVRSPRPRPFVALAILAAVGIPIGLVLFNAEAGTARAGLAPYPPGRDFAVRYDPADPQTAVLASTVAYPVRTIFIASAFGVLALYFGGAF